jgi:FemAB-related protein (PEP-CTERM system-associated)
MTVVVRLFDGTAAEWDAFVRGAPGWTHYHLFGWRHVIEEVFGHECPYLEARAGAELRGVLPLVRVRSRLFGHYLVSMPFLNYGGPLGSDEAVRALGEHAAALAERSGADLLELRARRELPLSLAPSHRKVTVLLDLPSGDPDLVWRALPAKVRSQVRRPQKEGVTVRFGADLVESFHQVFAQHMRDLGTPTQPARLFETIAERFGNDVWFGCAFLAGQPVAAGCAFRWGNEVELAWASALRQHSRIAPNMLLYWSFMERCVAEGVKTFNFGRCTPDSGTHQFKRQWGATRDEPLWWYHAGPRAGQGTPSPDGGAFAWGPRIWRRLPLALTNRLGPAVVRYIP